MNQVTRDHDLSLESPEVQQKWKEGEALALLTGQVFCGLDMKHEPVLAHTLIAGEMRLLKEALNKAIRPCLRGSQ